MGGGLTVYVTVASLQLRTVANIVFDLGDLEFETVSLCSPDWPQTQKFSCPASH